MSPQDRVHAALLFDVYGPLLTEHQQEIWQLYYLEDWSLAEIGTEQGISRAAVHDSLERTQRVLQDYEERLGLLAQHQRRQERLRTIMRLIAQLAQESVEVRALREAVAQLAEEEGLAGV